MGRRKKNRALQRCRARLRAERLLNDVIHNSNEEIGDSLPRLNDISRNNSQETSSSLPRLNDISHGSSSQNRYQQSGNSVHMTYDFSHSYNQKSSDSLLKNYDFTHNYNQQSRNSLTRGSDTLPRGSDTSQTSNQQSVNSLRRAQLQSSAQISDNKAQVSSRQNKTDTGSYDRNFTFGSKGNSQTQNKKTDSGVSGGQNKTDAKSTGSFARHHNDQVPSKDSDPKQNTLRNEKLSQSYREYVSSGKATSTITESDIHGPEGGEIGFKFDKHSFQGNECLSNLQPIRFSSTGTMPKLDLGHVLHSVKKKGVSEDIPPNASLAVSIQAMSKLVTRVRPKNWVEPPSSLPATKEEKLAAFSKMINDALLGRERVVLLNEKSKRQRLEMGSKNKSQCLPKSHTKHISPSMAQRAYFVEYHKKLDKLIGMGLEPGMFLETAIVNLSDSQLQSVARKNAVTTRCSDISTQNKQPNSSELSDNKTQPKQLDLSTQSKQTESSRFSDLNTQSKLPKASKFSETTQSKKPKSSEFSDTSTQPTRPNASDNKTKGNKVQTSVNIEDTRFCTICQCNCTYSLKIHYLEFHIPWVFSCTYRATENCPIAKIVHEKQLNALDLLCRYVCGAGRNEYDLLDYVNDQHLSETLLTKGLDEVSEYGLLSLSRFAGWMIPDQFTVNPLNSPVLLFTWYAMGFIMGQLTDLQQKSIFDKFHDEEKAYTSLMYYINSHFKTEERKKCRSSEKRSQTDTKGPAMKKLKIDETPGLSAPSFKESSAVNTLQKKGSKPSQLSSTASTLSDNFDTLKSASCSSTSTKPGSGQTVVSRDGKPISVIQGSRRPTKYPVKPTATVTRPTSPTEESMEEDFGPSGPGVIYKTDHQDHNISKTPDNQSLQIQGKPMPLMDVTVSLSQNFSQNQMYEVDKGSNIQSFVSGPIQGQGIVDLPQNHFKPGGAEPINPSPFGQNLAISANPPTFGQNHVMSSNPQMFGQNLTMPSNPPALEPNQPGMFAWSSQNLVMRLPSESIQQSMNSGQFLPAQTFSLNRLPFGQPVQGQGLASSQPFPGQQMTFGQPQFVNPGQAMVEGQGVLREPCFQGHTFRPGQFTDTPPMQMIDSNVQQQQNMIYKGGQYIKTTTPTPSIPNSNLHQQQDTFKGEQYTKTIASTPTPTIEMEICDDNTDKKKDSSKESNGKTNDPKKESKESDTKTNDPKKESKESDTKTNESKKESKESDSKTNDPKKESGKSDQSCSDRNRRRSDNSRERNRIRSPDRNRNRQSERSNRQSDWRERDRNRSYSERNRNRNESNRNRSDSQRRNNERDKEKDKNEVDKQNADNGLEKQNVKSEPDNQTVKTEPDKEKQNNDPGNEEGDTDKLNASDTQVKEKGNDDSDKPKNDNLEPQANSIKKDGPDCSKDTNGTERSNDKDGSKSSTDNNGIKDDNEPNKQNKTNDSNQQGNKEEIDKSKTGNGSNRVRNINDSNKDRSSRDRDRDRRRRSRERDQNRRRSSRERDQNRRHSSRERDQDRRRRSRDRRSNSRDCDRRRNSRDRDIRSNSRDRDNPNDTDRQESCFSRVRYRSEFDRNRLRSERKADLSRMNLNRLKRIDQQASAITYSDNSVMEQTSILKPGIIKPLFPIIVIDDDDDDKSKQIDSNNEQQKSMPESDKANSNIESANTDKYAKIHKVEGFDSYFHFDRLVKKIKIEKGDDFDVSHVENVIDLHGSSTPSLPVELAGGIMVFNDPETYKDVRFPLNAKWKVSLGVDPSKVQALNPDRLALLQSLLFNPLVSTVGGIGLDMTLKNLKQQEDAFTKVLGLLSASRPLLLHIRERYKQEWEDSLPGYPAHKRCLELLQQKCGKEQRILIHCFTGNVEVMLEWTTTYPNVMFGFSGNIERFDSEQKLALKSVPLSKILLETTAPFFSTELGVKYYSTPAYLGQVAKMVGIVKKANPEDILAQSLKNAKQFFRL